MPRGGRRAGSGRKPNRLKIKGLPARVIAHPSTPSVSAEPADFGPPDDLPELAKAVWLVQAPHAFRNQTLTAGQAVSFARYCALVSRERQVPAAEEGSSAHLALVRLINALELQFGLTSDGKPIARLDKPSEAPISKLGRFRT